jgi:predicted ATPase
MLLTSEYEIVELLADTDFLVVYRGIRLSDKLLVIIKQLKPQVRDEHTTACFANEIEILQSMKSEKTPHLLSVVSSLVENFIVIEDINGVTLLDLIENNEISFETKLDISLDIVHALSFIHQKSIIHNALNPQKIIYNKESKRLQIINYELSFFSDKIHHIQRLDQNQDFYAAPEQNDRVDNQVDERSDYYSLGMILYHMFLGQSPLSVNDQSELIHKQVAFSPTPLHIINDKIPEVLSQIIDKLISKKSSKRYQGIDALIYDLEKCISLCKASEENILFDIGSRDYPDLHIGKKLLCRDKELRQIKKIVKNMALSKAQRILISGASGVGKTRLCKELFQSVRSNVFVIEGKFDQYNQFPYLCFKQFFSQLSNYISESDRVLYCENIEPKYQRVLIAFFDELKTVFHPMQTKVHLSEEQMSLHIVDACRSFVNLLATNKHPLLIYIDDLQWADHASLHLLEQAIINLDNTYLHFLSSYRDDDIQDNKAALTFIKDAFISFHMMQTHIKVEAFSQADLKIFIENTLRTHSKSLNELSEILYRKTGGNPFYLKSFIEFLIDKQSLYFDEGEWNFDIDAIKSYEASTNIANMIQHRFEKLSQHEQSYLQYLSVFASRFNYNMTLEFMSKKGFSPKLFDDSFHHGFIEVFNENYQFIHDKIHHYIYNSLSTQERQKIHSSIGSFLENAYQNRSYDNIARIVHHKNLAYKKQNNFPQKLLALNILGLEELLSKNSPYLALEQLEWLDKHIDSPMGSLSAKRFELEYLRVKILYLNTFHDEALATLIRLIEGLDNFQNKLRCFTLYKDITVTKGEGFLAVQQLAHKLFKELSIKIPTANSLQKSSRMLIEEIESHKLFDKPLMILKSKNVSAKKSGDILNLFVHYWEVLFYLSDIERMRWSFLNIVDYSFRFGNSQESTFGYVLYASYLTSQQKYKKAQLFA